MYFVRSLRAYQTLNIVTLFNYRNLKPPDEQMPPISHIDSSMVESQRQYLFVPKTQRYAIIA